MHASKIQTTLADGILVVRLSDPGSLNALSTVMLKELERLLSSCEDPASNCGALVLTGDGSAFSSGWNRKLVADTPQEALEADAIGRRILAKLISFPKPTIAALRGPVVGGGVILAAACDFRVAAKSAYFWLPEITLGSPVLWAGLTPIVCEIGLSATRYLALSGKKLDALWAQSVGLVHEVVLDEKTLDEAIALAGAVGRFDNDAYRLSKRDLGRLRRALETTNPFSEDEVLHFYGAAGFFKKYQ